MANILGNATQKEKQLAQDLLELGAARAVRVAGEVVCNLREEACRVLGLYITNHGNLRDLLSKSKQPAMMPHRPPADDHGRLVFCEKCLPIVYLSQPYGLSYTDIRHIVSFSERWNLEVTINPVQALWYPGRTCAVAYSVPGATCGTPWEDLAN